MTLEWHHLQDLQDQNALTLSMLNSLERLSLVNKYASLSPSCSLTLPSSFAFEPHLLSFYAISSLSQILVSLIGPLIHIPLIKLKRDSVILDVSLSWPNYDARFSCLKNLMTILRTQNSCDLYFSNVLDGTQFGSTLDFFDFENYISQEIDELKKCYSSETDPKTGLETGARLDETPRLSEKKYERIVFLYQRKKIRELIFLINIFNQLALVLGVFARMPLENKLEILSRNWEMVDLTLDDFLKSKDNFFALSSFAELIYEFDAMRRIKNATAGNRTPVSARQDTERSHHSIMSPPVTAETELPENGGWILRRHPERIRFEAEIKHAENDIDKIIEISLDSIQGKKSWKSASRKSCGPPAGGPPAGGPPAGVPQTVGGLGSCSLRHQVSVARDLFKKLICENGANLSRAFAVAIHLKMKYAENSELLLQEFFHLIIRRIDQDVSRANEVFICPSQVDDSASQNDSSLNEHHCSNEAHFLEALIFQMSVLGERSPSCSTDSMRKNNRSVQETDRALEGTNERNESEENETNSFGRMASDFRSMKFDSSLLCDKMVAAELKIELVEALVESVVQELDRFSLERRSIERPSASVTRVSEMVPQNKGEQLHVRDSSSGAERLLLKLLRVVLDEQQDKFDHSENFNGQNVVKFSSIIKRSKRLRFLMRLMRSEKSGFAPICVWLLKDSDCSKSILTAILLIQNRPDNSHRTHNQTMHDQRTHDKTTCDKANQFVLKILLIVGRRVLENEQVGREYSADFLSKVLCLFQSPTILSSESDQMNDPITRRVDRVTNDRRDFSSQRNDRSCQDKNARGTKLSNDEIINDILDSLIVQCFEKIEFIPGEEILGNFSLRNVWLTLHRTAENFVGPFIDYLRVSLKEIKMEMETPTETPKETETETETETERETETQTQTQTRTRTKGHMEGSVAVSELGLMTISSEVRQMISSTNFLSLAQNIVQRALQEKAQSNRVSSQMRQLIENLVDAVESKIISLNSSEKFDLLNSLQAIFFAPLVFICDWEEILSSFPRTKVSDEFGTLLAICLLPKKSGFESLIRKDSEELEDLILKKLEDLRLKEALGKLSRVREEFRENKTNLLAPFVCIIAAKNNSNTDLKSNKKIGEILNEAFEVQVLEQFSKILKEPHGIEKVKDAVSEQINVLSQEDPDVVLDPELILQTIVKLTQNDV